MAKLIYGKNTIEGFSSIKVKMDRENGGYILATDNNKILKISHNTNRPNVIEVHGNVKYVNVDRNCTVIGNVEYLKASMGIYCEGSLPQKDFDKNGRVVIEKDIRITYGEQRRYQKALNSHILFEEYELIEKPVIRIEGDLQTLNNMESLYIEPIIFGNVETITSDFDIHVKGNIGYCACPTTHTTAGIVPEIDFKQKYQEYIDKKNTEDEIFNDIFGDIFNKNFGKSNEDYDDIER